MKNFIRTYQLTRAIASIEKERDNRLRSEHSVNEGLEVLIATGKRIEPLQEELDRLKTKYLVKKTTKLGIDIPKECWHYVSDPMFPGFAPLDWYLQETANELLAN